MCVCVCVSLRDAVSTRYRQLVCVSFLSHMHLVDNDTKKKMFCPGKHFDTIVN